MVAANSINLARRDSVKNENDLMQEEFSSPASTPRVTKNECFQLIDKVCPDSPLPLECQQYSELKMALQRQNTNKHSHAIAFEGMLPGQAMAAKMARERGKLNHAQIQRRMTSSGKEKLRWWA